MTTETVPPPADPTERIIGRPPRPVPDNVMALAWTAYNSGRTIGIPLPEGTTVDDVDAFRLDMRAAARRIGGERVVARIGGRLATGATVAVDRRVKRETWGDLVMLYVRVKRIGVA